VATVLDRRSEGTPQQAAPIAPPSSVEALTAALIRPIDRPWPKICLTSGCDLQMAALASASVGGSIYMAKAGEANRIQTAQSSRGYLSAIESSFVGRADSQGYVPYSSISRGIKILDNRTGQVQTVDMDKVTNADRSIPVLDADVDFVARIIRRLRDAEYRVTPFNWTVVPTKVVNSSSFPDPPFVFVYTSILDLTNRDPNQVAFVIAHEIGHTIDAKSCSASGSPFDASLGITLIQNQFQKFCENHADNVGLQLVAGAGFDPRAAVALFQKLQWYQQQAGMSDASAFLGNHPLNASRIKNVEDLLPIIERTTAK